MSKCMTIDESIDQRDTCTELAPKEIVEFILEEVLLSAFIILEKELARCILAKQKNVSNKEGCSRIGDFNIPEDFRQQFDQISILKDFEQLNNSRNQSATSQETNLISGGNADRSAGLVTTRENLELIIDSFVKKEDKVKSPGECRVISEDVLADNELQIQNGQIHLEKNNAEKIFCEPDRQKYFDKEDVIKDEKIEIEYFNDGKLNKIYVPLNAFNDPSVEGLGPDRKEQKNSTEKEKVVAEGTEKGSAPGECEETKREPSLDNVSGEVDTESPFKSYAAEVRQLNLPAWGNGNSSSVGRWEGDVPVQREEAVRLMEDLSCVQAYPDSSADPNRPRACAFAEEDVKKMIKEIEEISFAQNCEDFDLCYNPDGQGDADLESKSFVNSLKNMKGPEKPDEASTGFVSESSSGDVKNGTEAQRDRERERNFSREIISGQGQLLPLGPCSFAQEVETFTTAPEGDGSDSRNEASAPPEPGKSAGGTEWERSSEREKKEEEDETRYDPRDEIATSGAKSAANDSVGSAREELPPREGTPRAEVAPSCPSASNDSFSERGNDFFTTDSVIKEFQSDRKPSEERFPEATSPSEDSRIHGGKPGDFTPRNFELVSELDDYAFQGKRSDVVKESRSVSDAQETAPESSWQTQQGTISLGRLNTATSETYNRINLDSFSEEKNLELLSMDSNLFGLIAEEKRKSKEAGNFLQDSNSWSDRYESDFGNLRNNEDPNSVTEGFNESQGEVINCGEANAENLENKVEHEGNAVEKSETEDHASPDDSDSTPSQNESKKSLNLEGSNGTDIDRGDSSTSSGTQVDNEPNENGFSEGADASDPGTQRFRLHSQKMYWGPKHKMSGPTPNEFVLTQSEEAFIDMTESVIQIIEPPENNDCEDFSKILFSLLSEDARRKADSSDLRPQASLEKCDSSDIESPTKQIYSGMTTIGPIKNSDYDPKDLTAPEIDYGKMTRITSSRTLAKDMSMFSSDVTTVKIIEEDDSSDDNLSLNADDDRLERTSLVNRDIASLTKVQKVREVMSYQPKPEEDFEDEEALARPRLDLKDVESMTDERYKVPDVSIPLLSFEIGDGNLETEKDLMDSMGLVISGLTNPAFYDEEIEEDYTTIERNLIALNNERDRVEKYSENSVNGKQSSQIIKVTEEEIPIINLEAEIGSELPKETKPSPEGDSRHEGLSGNPKYGTLGSVFKRASSKLLRMDGDLFSRNTKSLPRDPSRSSATESIRSLLDDCHSSASNMLRKSRSLLKNSQSLLKSISQSRVTSEHAAGQKKLSPSDSDVTAIEKKFSGFVKKEDFAKAKNLIMTKIERKFKNVDSDPFRSPSRDENVDLRVAVRNERNLQVDRMENFKKAVPKSPLVYKSQFVKSQGNVRRGSQGSEDLVSNSKLNEDEQAVEVVLEIFPADDRACRISSEDTDFQEPEDSKNPFFSQAKEPAIGEILKPSVQEDLNEESESKLPDFIVMETIPGLPATDLGLSVESVAEKRSPKDVENVESQKEESHLGAVEGPNSLQAVADGSFDVAPCFPEIDEEKIPPKTPSEKKIKTKKKKFTARFRSFWCSAFGKVKAPSKKGDLS